MSLNFICCPGSPVTVAGQIDIQQIRDLSKIRQFGVRAFPTDVEALLDTAGREAIGMAVGSDQPLSFGKA